MTDHKDCGCTPEEEQVMKVLFDGEDEEVPCDVLGIFPVDDVEYIALVPRDKDDQVLIYGFQEEGEGIQLTEIETDEEYEKVAKIFQEEYFREESE